MLQKHRRIPPGEVLLVSCYELGHQPLGLATPAGVLENAGYSPVLNDISVQPFDEETVASASFVGISVPMHTALRLGVRVARRVREINPAVHVCFYGMYAALNREYLETIGADSCLGAEFEADLTALVARVLAGDSAGTRVASRESETPLKTRANRALRPVPSRGGLPPVERYARFDDGEQLRNAGASITTRGCKHVCRHCPVTPVYEGSFYAIPVDDVLRDVEALVAAGVEHVTFADPDFLNGPGHARRVTSAVHERFPRLTFDYTAKIEHLLAHRDVVVELSDRGCAFVVSAVESFNNEVLRHLGKGHTREDALSVFRYFRDAGLTIRPSLVPFTPWESMESYSEMLDIVESEGLVDHIDPVQYSIRLLVPPGSPLLVWRGFLPYLGELDAESFSHRWDHPDPRMDALQQDIAALAETGVRNGESPRVTFEAVTRAAAKRRGIDDPGSRIPLSPNATSRPAPRLTEPWFC